MIAVGVILVGLAVGLVRWRRGHRHRRSVELGAGIAQRQPWGEWVGRYPATRPRVSRSRGAGRYVR